ncbi:hypothetical protein [Paucibacter soli]|uniref:hypothetical protein n=1 Tax=Paucibacter soli TaxID=3133433 RepID=UPI0030A43343
MHDREFFTRIHADAANRLWQDKPLRSVLKPAHWLSLRNRSSPCSPQQVHMNEVLAAAAGHIKRTA